MSNTNDDYLGKIYLEGYSAHWSWLWEETGPEPQNPYEDGTPEAAAWQDGYTEAGQDW